MNRRPNLAVRSVVNLPETDARAWATWLVCALGLLFLVDHPFIDLLAILASGLIASLSGGSSPFRSFLTLAVVLIAFRTVLSALTGHTGDTILVELPAFRLPELLGGSTLGGKITAEVVATALAEGLRIASVLACFGAFLAVTETIELIRLLPRFLFEAGLVVNIALAFAPLLARTVREAQEAQRMRGGRSRVAPLVVPVLGGALERSISLAEAMDSRGYGRKSDSSAGTQWRWLAALASITLTSSGSFWALKRDSTPAALVAIAAGTALIVALVGLNRTVPRSRYRRRRFTAADKWVALVAAGTVLVALVLAASGATPAPYNPYLSLAVSPPNALATAAALALALPALMVRSRAAR